MSSADSDPVSRPFDGYAAIRWAIEELRLLAAKLGSTLAADEADAAGAADWPSVMPQRWPPRPEAREARHICP